MEPNTPIGKRAVLLAALFALATGSTFAQTQPACVTSGVPVQVRAEGLTERIGDILLQCSGYSAGAVLSGNLTIFLPVGITNRVDANNQTQDAVLFVDYGSGFVPTGIAGLVASGSMAFNGISFTVPPSGNLSLKISNVRANMSQLGGGLTQSVTAYISSSSLPISQSQVVVAYPRTSLFATVYGADVPCTGSALASTTSLSILFSARTVFASTRITEGFAGAFAKRAAGDDTGTRFLIGYSGFPPNTHVYIPDMVAGSSALVPTAGGDLGVTQAVGQYVPGSGTSLLVRVPYADATGAGGYPLSAPSGIGPVLLDSVSEVPLTNGAGWAVYEVADTNPAVQESAQFPAFISVPNATAAAVGQESLSYAPVSTVMSASISAPVPRFTAGTGTPPSDCTVLGDCQAGYFPKLSIDPTSVQLAAIAGGAMTNGPGYIPVQNSGGGIMNWTAVVSYATGSGWLILDYTAGQNDGSVRVWPTVPVSLAAGTYQARIIIDAGPLAGNATIPVTLTVQAAPVLPPTPTPTPTPPAPVVTVTSVVNAATFAVTPLVPGSLSTLLGANLSGKNVSVTFDGSAAILLYVGVTQINLQVPVSLGSKTSASLVVTVDGSSSAPLTVALAPVWPAIFPHGVLNQDYTENKAGTPAKAGSVLQIFATGIPTSATVSVQIADRKNLIPLYAGAAPGLTGVQQVNVAIPADLGSGATQLIICATAGSQQACSAGYPVVIQ
jgi:uncharacterized protein (TIGR03437 family)